MEEVTINLIDLCRRILHRWKFVLIVMLICGLVFEGIGYARAQHTYQRELQESGQEDTESNEYLSEMEEIEEGLSEREIMEAQVAATSYGVQMAKYQEELLYCQNAVKMQLDSNHVPTYILHYSIANPDSDTQVADRVASAVTELVKDEGTCEEIKTALGWGTELSYVDELISVGTEEAIVVNDMLELGINGTKQVKIEILAPKEEDCQTIAELLKSHIEQETANLQGTYGEFELTLLNETYTEKADDELRTYQESKLLSLNNIRSSISSLTAGMTDDQQDYFYDLIAYNMSNEGEDGIAVLDEDEDLEGAGTLSPPSIIRWRFILIGLFLGLVLACGYLLLQYIFSKNLRVKDDMERTFGVSLLGYFPTDEKKQKFTKEERMEMICAGIRVAIKKANMKSIYVTGTGGDGESNQIIEQIQSALSDSEAQVSSGRDVACDPASLEQMTASDGVVFVERIDRSPYADIRKEVESCQTYNISIIGSVVIE